MSSDEMNLKPTRMRTHPHTTRSRLMLEVASELVNKRLALSPGAGEFARARGK